MFSSSLSPTAVPLLPTEMKAVAYRKAGELDAYGALLDVTVPLPNLRPMDVLVEVKAIAVNPVDTKIRKSRMPAEGELGILGWDAAGVVVAVGTQVQAYAVGDRVYYAGDLTRAGSNSQYHAVDERIVGRMPTQLDFAQAAALPLTAITAWELLVNRLELAGPTAAHPEPVLLVSGAAGGVGSILVQLARLKTQARIVATASRPESAAWVLQMGAHDVINHQLPLADELNRIGVAQVTHVVSLVDTAAYYEQFIAALAPQGKLALIDDPQVPLDLRPLKLTSLSLHWELMFTRSMFQTPDIRDQQLLLNEVAELIDQGKLKSTVAQVLSPMSAATLTKAHQFLEQGKTIGKIVVTNS